MKAKSLSISLPNDECNKDCPYCVSKMTGYTESNIDKFLHNLHKAVKMADNTGVTSVLLTGKGEPILPKYHGYIGVVSRFFKDYPLEIQTNGIVLKDTIKHNSFGNLGKIFEAYELNYIDTFAFSIDNWDFLKDKYTQDLFEELIKMGKTIRLTVNLLPGIYEKPPEKYINYCNNIGIQQLSFRETTIPNYRKNTELSDKTAKWINNNVTEGGKSIFLDTYYRVLKEKGQHIMSLPYGADIYQVDNVSCTHFEYCVQDKNDSDDIRSLIYYEDGHMSTTWYGSNVGRIF